MPPFPCRVILLLDLDCFYAQCERVRLRLSPDVALALLQWDSVLAVTYPARHAFGIKRGDSWDAIHAKSNGKCLALHLPILTKADASSATSSATADAKQEETVEQAYQRVYCLDPQEQGAIREKELGVRRYAHEGKACLERYRLASSRIFGVVLATLEAQLGKGNFILERASIDELFLDVTKYCWENEAVDTSDAMAATVCVGNNEPSAHRQDQDEHDTDSTDTRIQQALERGCLVAHHVRKAIYDALGFTLSAGISTTKLVAKLGASYGKPNGQAIILPSSIPHVMDETEIRKVRNLGGKVGKQVQALLPADATMTMGSIARLLSLPTLCEKLGNETGKMVLDACRGMDEESVKETIGALVKSITAFKSFHQTSITSGEITEWITLLATDVVTRVQLDATRNNRYPKTCTIQYTCSRDSRSERSTKSVRIPFPRDGNVKAKLVQQSKNAVYAKEGKVFLYRFGLCAVDFQTRMANGGISSFFSSKSPVQQVSQEEASSATATLTTNDANDEAKCSQDEEITRKLQSQYESNLKAAATPGKQASPKPATNNNVTSGGNDADMELARKLQAQYDRENYVLSTAEKRKVIKPNPSSKKQRIDSFFRKA